MATGINTYNETSLHAALKSWYADDGARFEVSVDGFIVDVVQDGILVEIQTANFTAMRRKIRTLIESHPVRLVFPVAQEKWIVRMDQKGDCLGRRKSPKRGRVEDVFSEFVTFPQLLQQPNFSLAVVLIQEEEIRLVDGKRRRRGREWARKERRLLKVVGHHLFLTPSDALQLVPESVEDPFTTADLAKARSLPRRLAQKMAYCLREMGAIIPVERKGKGVLYRRGKLSGVRRNNPKGNGPRTTRSSIGARP